MNNVVRQTSILRQLVWKDVQIHAPLLMLTTIFGVLGLALLLPKREPVSVVGGVTLLIALIIMSALLAGSNILNERKKQTLPFMMSLPISSMEYTTAKLVGSVGMYLIPWLTLGIAMIWLIGVRGVLPHGTIPVALIIFMLPLVGMCGYVGLNLVGETEGWNILAAIIFNTTPGMTWYGITRMPTLMIHLADKTPVWNATALRFLASEFALIILILALTYYLQSRKRDFV